MSKSAEVLERALQDLLREADTALAALEKIANTCPSVIEETSLPGSATRTFCYHRWDNHQEIFARFVIGESGVKKYEWGYTIVNPGGLLAAMLRRERKKLASIGKLAEVTPEED